jgi:uncharacterized membrane protein
MDKKTIAIIVTVAAVLLCGCPGLFSLLLGGMFALISFIPGANIDVFGSNDPRSALNFGIGGLCVGVVFVLIAAAAIFFAWRRKSGTMPGANTFPPTV